MEQGAERDGLATKVKDIGCWTVGFLPNIESRGYSQTESRAVMSVATWRPPTVGADFEYDVVMGDAF